MALTVQGAEDIRRLVEVSVKRLSEAQVPPARLAEFHPASKRFLFSRKARFTEISSVWPLGVLLLSPAGDLYTAGETTRAVPPGHPGHVSVERERRREYTRVAYESGFEHGEVLYFNSPRIPVEPGAVFGNDCALSLTEDGARVRWNRNMPGSATVPLATYLDERISLSIERLSAP